MSIKNTSSDHASTMKDQTSFASNKGEKTVSAIIVTLSYLM